MGLTTGFGALFRGILGRSPHAFPEGREAEWETRGFRVGNAPLQISPVVRLSGIPIIRSALPATPYFMSDITPSLPPDQSNELPSALAGLIAELEALRKQQRAGKKAPKPDKPERIGSGRGVETLFRTAYRVNMDLSALADTKSNIMMSINGIIISVLIAAKSATINTNILLLLPAAVLLIGCAVSMVFAVQAARPRVLSQHLPARFSRKESPNILFFANFARMEEDEFVDSMIDLLGKNDAVYVSMIRNIYGVGRVLDIKFRLLQRAYTAFMVSLVAGVLSFLAAYFATVGAPGS